MTVNRFRFVSPGVKINEIDRSVISANNGAIGPVVVGRFQRGPGLMPVTVQSYADFDNAFGPPTRGVVNSTRSDVWRTGQQQSPTYAAYAAEAWLKNSSPLTTVRVLGVQHPSVTESSTDDSKAGWKAEEGAWGVFIAPTAELTGAGVTGTLAAIIYLQDGLVELGGTSFPTPAVSATGSLGNLQYTAVDAGAAGNNFVVTHQEGSFAVVVTGSSVTVTIPSGSTGDAVVTFLNTETDFTDVLTVSGDSNPATTSGAVTLAGGVDAVGESFATGSNTFFKSTGNDFEFRIIIKDSESEVKVNSAFNLNKSSAKHIRKVLNTNPVLTNSDIIPAAALKTYWLGETFDSFVKSVLGGDASEGSVSACVVQLQSSVSSIGNFGNHLGVQAQPAKTGWIISQDLNSVYSDYKPHQMPKLFRFSTLGGEAGDSSGEWEQKNIKISIEDVRASNNTFNKYGSFTVRVRRISDSDKKQEVLETFTNCNLDPTSQNYVARLIGDKFISWDSESEKHRVIGNFDNRSKYIRVEVDRLLEQGALDPELLPFGFFGPPRFVSASLADGENSVNEALFSGNVNAGVNAELLFPTIPLVSQVTASQRGSKTHFGFDTSNANGRIFNEDVLDLLRAKPAHFDSYEATAGDGSENSPVFSLDDVVITGSSANVGEWVTGSREAGDSLTATGSATGSNEGYKNVLNSGFNSFTMPLFGGSDGFRITEKDPLRNEPMLNAEPDGKTNYVVYSLRRALDSVADPEVLDMNLLTIPGVTNEVVTNRAIEICETRADALAIIDVPGGYRPEADPADPEDLEVDRVGSSNETIQLLKSRDFNTSYACTYYPWVKVKDQRENGDVWMPPSVVALGTMASSQEVSAVWFAPAGFNRGGLDRGSSGLTVTQVREVLKATQRDELYEVNINPIARFPAEGIVIFGQKTLQATPSALDRINVRRLVLFLKKQISKIASELLFDQNIKTTWQRFINQVNPLMDATKGGGGIVDYKVILDETTTTPDLIDRNTMYAKIFIKPAYAIEFIGIDFVITNSGASFDDL